MNTEIQNTAQQTFRSHLTYLSSGKIREWVNLFTENGILEFPYGPQGFPKKIEGKKALYEYMKNFPKHFKVEFINLFFHPTANPNLVIAEFESNGIALSTGNPYQQKYISIVKTTDEGKIFSYIDFWNPIVAMEALGTSVNGEKLTQSFTEN
ncbi:nuclear transport factor 2 family protein [Aquimarina gracilis]|uniref:Nuclear transport factor 2 family protein n=1 Tax=Aquimarina gracilis TaxID=874422 RepID=A0ABU6A0H0_9FLAO|nr:nuclear transport factor 2 family protein [Aquimarina gracilis]MEB3347609.1 nuclear transport factor 2 family protein [Aquimarina gracilis]